MKPIRIDGSFGEGGGQILRTALGLSLATGRPFEIEKIRAGRKDPGLLRQHLTCVVAAQQISNARVEGATLKSQSLAFTPGPVQPGEYKFSIGSAGSTTLVLQAVLPGLIRAQGSSRLVLEGGTHNMAAPPFDFLALAFVPLLQRMGLNIRLTLERHGFYPAGGGRFVADIIPAKLTPLNLRDRGSKRTARAVALLANLRREIGKREIETAARILGLSKDEQEIEHIKESAGPGNTISIRAEFENVTEVFTGFGRMGRSAEQVAADAAEPARDFLANSGAAVAEHLADQLLIPLALAGGGSFTTVTPTLHTRTNIEVIRMFLPVDFEVSERGTNVSLVEFR